MGAACPMSADTCQPSACGLHADHTPSRSGDSSGSSNRLCVLGRPVETAASELLCKDCSCPSWADGALRHTSTCSSGSGSCSGSGHSMLSTGVRPRLRRPSACADVAVGLLLQAALNPRTLVAAKSPHLQHHSRPRFSPKWCEGSTWTPRKLLIDRGAFIGTSPSSVMCMSAKGPGHLPNDDACSKSFGPVRARK